MMKRKYKLIALGIVFCIGILARIYRFPDVPNGFNQDEAFTGYEAFSLISTTRDSHGLKWPCHFEGFGMGQSVLYSYLDMPFVYIFGVNVFSQRIVNLLFGIIALFIFSHLVGKTNDYETKLIAIFLASVAPWHIMSSRWGHESYLFPNIFLIAVTFLFIGLKKPMFLIMGALLSGICLYSYSTAHFFIPVFLFFFIFCYRKVLFRNRVYLVFSILLFGIVSLPIFVFLIKNISSVNTLSIENYIPFGIPKLPHSRVLSLLHHNSFVEYIKMIFHNIKLLSVQYDGLPYNAVKGLGAIYLISIPFMILGFFKNVTLRIEYQDQKIFLIWIIAASLSIFMIPININRISIIWFPLVYYTACGIRNFASKFKNMRMGS